MNLAKKAVCFEQFLIGFIEIRKVNFPGFVSKIVPT